MQLGNCTQCGGQLGLVAGFRTDAEGYLLSPAGARVGRAGDERPPSGPVDRHAQVQCVVCRAPGMVPGPNNTLLPHPYQAELDAAHEARKRQAAVPPPVPAPTRYRVADEFGALAAALGRVDKTLAAHGERLAEQAEQIAGLEEELASLREQAGKRTPAGKR